MSACLSAYAYVLCNVNVAISHELLILKHISDQIYVLVFFLIFGPFVGSLIICMQFE